MNFAWNPSLFGDAAVEQELSPLSWRESEHISTHTLKIDVRQGRIIQVVTYALHNSFLPLGPFRHSGLEVALQLEHFCTPVGLLPAARLDPDPG